MLVASLLAFPPVLDVHIEILEDDGGVIPACIVAASLALADSGVSLYDLVGSVCVGGGGGGGAFTLDPNREEGKDLGVTMEMSVMGNLGKVTMYEQRGGIEVERIEDMEEVCRGGCMAVHEIMRKSLLKREEERVI